MTRRYLIAGSGAAGLAAAETIRQQDASASVTIVTEDRYLYYSRPGLAYWLSGEVTGEQLFPFKPDYYQQIGLQVRAGRVARLQPAEHRAVLSSGESIVYDRLLIATGASANRLELPGSQAAGVVKLDNMDDAGEILKRARRGKTAVVVGGGITALELAEGLCARGMRVHYLLRGDRYWSAVLDEVESRIVEQRLKDDGITIHYNAQLVSLVVGRGGELAGVCIRVGERDVEIKCTLLGVAIGIHPRVELAQASGLETRQGVVTDPCLQTSAADVFAAGDVAEVYDPQRGEYLLDSLWGPAIEQGRIAGLNMTGAQTRFIKKMPFNVTRLGGLVTTIIGQVGKPRAAGAAKPGDADLAGINRGDSEVWRVVPDAVVAQSDAGVNRVRVHISARQIAGALVMGDQTLSRPLQQLVRQGVDISAIRPALLVPGAPVSEIIAAFWQRWRASAPGSSPMPSSR